MNNSVDSLKSDLSQKNHSLNKMERRKKLMNIQKNGINITY